MATKQVIVNKLDKLEELINKNHESGEDLFPKHWLILLQVKNEVNKSTEGDIPRDFLEKMNKIWKINKSIERAGSSTEFEIEIWQTIEEFLQDNDKPNAIRTFQGSFVKDDGSEYSLSDAKNSIETHIKKKKKKKK